MLGLTTPHARRSLSREGTEEKGQDHVESFPVEVDVMEAVVERLRSQRKKPEGQRSRPHRGMLRIFNIQVITHRLYRQRDRLVRRISL